MQAVTIACPACKAAVEVGAFLAACSEFDREVDAVRFTCPLCRHSTEARVEHALISLGYVYAAGSLHFCGMIDVRIDGLRVWREAGGLVAELGDLTWKIPARGAH